MGADPRAAGPQGVGQISFHRRRRWDVGTARLLLQRGWAVFDFRAWVERMGEDGSRLIELLPPERDTGAVRDGCYRRYGKPYGG